MKLRPFGNGAVYRGVSLWLSGLACALLFIAAPGTAAGFPVTSISGVPEGWAPGDVAITLAATPPDGALSWFSLDGAASQLYGGPFVVSREGTTTIVYWSRDGHSAMEEPGVATVRIDRTPPSCGVSGVSEEWSAAGRVTATISAADPLSGVSQVSCRIGGGTVSAVTGPVPIDAATSTWIEYWATDGAGNSSPVRLSPVRVADGLPLTCPAGLPVGWSRADVTIGLTAESQDAPIATTLVSLAGAPARACAGPVTVSTEGVNRVEFRSIDALGHAEATRAVDVAIDRTPPTSWAAGLPSGVSSSAVTVGLRAVDTVSGVAGIRYSVDGGPAQTAMLGSARLLGASGALRLEWWAVDAAGNEEAHHSADLIFDTVAPMTTCDAQPSYAGTATIHLAPADAPDGTGVASTWYRVDGIGSPLAGTTVAVAAPGAHSLEYWSVDGAGNVEARSWRTFLVTAIGGSTPPTSAIPPTSSVPPTSSAAPTATPAPRLVVGTPYAPSAARRGRTFTVSGTIRPRLTASAAVRVELWRRVSGRWRLQTTVRPALARVSGATRYSVRLRLTRPGRWRMRVWATSGGRRTYSGWRYIRIL